MKDSGERRPRRLRLSGKVSLALAMLLVAISPSLALANPPRPAWNPGAPWAPLNPASPEMLSISNLFWVMLILSAIVFIIVAGGVVFSAVRFSAKPGQTEPTQSFGNRRVEILWTMIPFLVLIVAFGFTVRSIHDINTPPKGTILNIDAIGHQWWWEFEYPAISGVKSIFTADELHVPAGVELHFHVESQDVIHSFWIPRLQRQIDANPGQDNAVFVKMPRTGIYGGACYEYCGTDHAWMKFEVVVQSPTAFRAWVNHELQPSAKPPKGSLLAAGQKVFLQNTCVSCHTIAGVSVPKGQIGPNAAVAPNLTHLGSRWTVGAGAAPMTRSAIAQWVHNPDYFKPGVLMPPYPLLSHKQLRALAAYLYSLK
ncbi:MAG: cytochrome c oxidase subunit II [Chloroflexota bacterium]